MSENGILKSPVPRVLLLEQVKVGAGRQENVEGDRSSEKVKVYLRIRPLAEEEKVRGEDQVTHPPARFKMLPTATTNHN